MSSQTTGRARLILTWILRVLLGVIFLGIGIEKLTGTMGTIPFFDAIGWGQWFRYASGVLDTAGALLVFAPRWTSLGALIITCTVGPGNFSVLHQGALQSDLSTGDDPVGRNTGVACVAA